MPHLDREKAKAYYKEYYRKNQEYFKTYRANNRERINEYARQYSSTYQRKHPRIITDGKRQYDLEKVFEKRFGGLRNIVLERDDFMCQLCGITRDEHKEKYRRDIAIDHIDGDGRNSPNPNNDLSNLRVLCLVCNLRVARESKEN